MSGLVYLLHPVLMSIQCFHGGLNKRSLRYGIGASARVELLFAILMKLIRANHLAPYLRTSLMLATTSPNMMAGIRALMLAVIALASFGGAGNVLRCVRKIRTCRLSYLLPKRTFRQVHWAPWALQHCPSTSLIRMSVICNPFQFLLRCRLWKPDCSH